MPSPKSYAVTRSFAPGVSPTAGRRLALLLLLFMTAWAVQANPDSLQVWIHTAVEKEVNSQLWPLRLLEVGVASLTLFGLYTWFFGIKMKVDALIKEKAAAQVDEALAKLTGARADTLQAYFRQYQAERDALAQKRVWVVFAPGVAQQGLMDYLHRVGVEQATGIDTHFDLANQIQANDFLVFVDEDGASLSDQDIEAYGAIGQVKVKGKFFYYGPRRYAGQLPMVSFANTQASLLNRLKDAILQ